MRALWRARRFSPRPRWLAAGTWIVALGGRIASHGNCTYIWKIGEVLETASCVFEVVTQLLFAEVKCVHAIVGQAAQKVWFWTSGKLCGSTR